MLTLIRLLPVLVLAVPVFAVPGSAWAQSEERVVYASVLDKGGSPAAGLSAADFIVREDEIAREVLRASTATEPMQIAVLVDNSQASDPYITDLRAGLRSFFKEMQGKHEIALIGFGERPTVLVDYTRDLARLEKGVGSVFPRNDSGTQLLDAIVETSDALARRKATRPVMIVITARGPEFSERHHDSVVSALRESRATLHSFVITKPGAFPNDRAAQEVELTFADGTRLTGGRREDLLTSMGLSDRLRSVAAELNNQYQVVYARPPKLIPPKTLDVSVKRPGVTVRARRIP